VHNGDTRSVDSLETSISTLVNATSDQLLLQVFEIAQEYQLDLPIELNQTILFDESQPIELRVHCLRSLADEESIEFSLHHAAWQLRSAGLELLLDIDNDKAVTELLQRVTDGEVHEAQAAIQILAKQQTAFEKINKEELPAELQLEYAEASGMPLMFGDPLESQWLVQGGDARRGKVIVFEHSRSECLRCHKVKDHGGIAGPSLDGVSTRLDDQQLLVALLMPSSEVADGFGESSAMPPMGVLLNHQEIRDVIAYLKTLE
jgi:mono/diheme cytochrome c family protein